MIAREDLPEGITYCYNKTKRLEDLVIEDLAAPLHHLPLTTEGLLYIAVPSYSTLALYPYRGDISRYKLPNVRLFNILHYFSVNPLTRLGDVTISLAIPPRFEAGTPLLPISRLAPIYKFDPDNCKETLHTVPVATALRVTRPGLDLIISMITSTLTMLALNLGDPAVLRNNLEGLIQAYLAKANILASSPLRTHVQEIARIIDVANPSIKRKIERYLQEIKQAASTNTKKTNSKLAKILDTVLKDETIMSTILGRIIKEDDITHYIGNLQQTTNSILKLLEKQAAENCEKLRKAEGLAYGVTGQFSLYDITLIQKTLQKCDREQEAYLIITPETLPLLAVTLNIIKDIQFDYLDINATNVSIKANHLKINLTPVLTSYTDLYTKQILYNLKKSNIILFNQINIISII